MRISSVRALALVIVLSSTIAPAASARLRGQEAPRFDRERIVRIIKHVLKQLGVSTNEQIAVPKP